MNTERQNGCAVLFFPLSMESNSATLSEVSVVIIKFGLQETRNTTLEYTHIYLPSSYSPFLGNRTPACPEVKP